VVRSKRLGSPVLIVSGDPDPDLGPRALAEGAAAFLAKPIPQPFHSLRPVKRHLLHSFHSFCTPRAQGIIPAKSPRLKPKP